MAATVPQYKSTMQGTIGTGMRVILGGKFQRYYTLEHIGNSRYYKSGEQQKIIVDQIELGRSSRCQVRFDSSEFPTVSGIHAAIQKDGDSWKLIHLSQTNGTYVNGRSISGQYYLQTGDEIQLSSRGPKMRFVIPTGENADTSNINLTARLNLFRQQALRPYRTALWSIAIVLILAIGVQGYFDWKFQHDLDAQAQQFATQINDINREIAAHTNHLGELDNKAIALQEQANALGDSLTAVNRKMNDFEDNMKKMKKDIINASQRANQAWRQTQNLAVVTHIDNAALQKMADNTYFVMFGIFLGDECVSSCTGTGFLLKNGKFITAQHVVNPFMGSVNNINDAVLNAFMNAVPETFTCIIKAVNQKGRVIQKRYSLKDNIFRWGNYQMNTVGSVPYEGQNLPIKVISEVDYRDYAWFNAGAEGEGMEFDNEMSVSMPNGAPLDILGFPQGVGAENINKVSPISSQSTVARQGLDTDKCILLSNSETDHGNSGGPVLTVKDGIYVVIGILSGANRLGSKTIDWDRVASLPVETQNAIIQQVQSAKMKDRVVPIANCN